MTGKGIEGGLASYRELIHRYHATLDLISDRALGSLDDLFVDALAYVRLIGELSPAPETILDVGSGVGLPGIPIALGFPRARVVLAERRRRRCAFLRIAISQLQLDNASLHEGDVRMLEGPAARVVTAQAVGSLPQLYGLTRHLHADRTWLVTRGGDELDAELEALRAEIGTAAAEAREVPLASHGRLLAVSLPGGRACPPSG